MRRVLSKPVFVFHAFLAGLCLLVAQQTPPGGDPQGEPPPQEEVPAAPAAIAESGLLPVFGLTVELNSSWVDGKKFPSEQPNGGIADALEQMYTGQLLPCGFNVIRVPFDVTQSDQSTKLANLCVWAQAKGLKLVPILTSPQGKPVPGDFAAKSKSFVSSLIEKLKSQEGAFLGAYMQISFFQLGQPLNSPVHHGAMDPADAAALLKQAAVDVRTAEVDGFAEVGLSPTQIMVPASLDFELLKNGAIAGAELKPEAYGLGFESLKTYLGMLADSSEIGTFNVEYYPGSISSEAPDKLSELVRTLLTDVQGKLLLVSTGYSTAFRSHENQSQFYALGFANLADIRASEGVDCPFTGVFWASATDGSGANSAPPSAKTAENISQWDLAAKSSELVQMWQSGGGDPDLAWWWTKTKNSFGILSADGSSPKQAHQVLTELQGATAQAAVETGVAEAAQAFEEAQAQAIQGQADPAAGGGGGGLPVDPNTGLPIDPNTGLPVDPNTGLPIDPNTGLPIDPNNPPIDPNTGLPIGAPAGGPLNVADELKNTLNGALSQLIGGIIEKGKQGLTNLIGRLLGDPTLSSGDPGGGGFPVDPNTGLPIDPNTGLPVDPNTGLPIDPSTGLPIDPNTGLPVDPNTGLPPDRTGGGGAPAGSSGQADLAFEGAAPTLGGLTTNEPVTITVNMKNNGDTAAQGATAYLVDGEGNAFAASEMVAVEPGAVGNAIISFTPPSAGTIPGVQLLLFCDNETNVADNTASLGSLSISDPAGGVDPGVTPEEPGGGEDPGGGTGGGGGRPGGLKPGIIGGLIKVRPLPPGLIGLKPKIGVTTRPPGFVPKLSLIKPGMFNIGTVLPGSAARLVMKTDPLMAGDGPMAPKTIGYPVGQIIPLTIPMTNPFKRTFKNVRATLFVNGSQLATRSMGTIMPKQTKTVYFNNFKPTSPGLYNIEVRMEATGLRNRTQLAKAACQVNVLDGKESTAVIRPTVIPSAGGAGKPGASGRPLVKLARPSFGLVPTVVKTSIVRPILLPAGGSTRPTGAPTKGFTLPVIGSFNAPAKASLLFSSGDIGMLPFPPAENAAVSVSAKVRNVGMASARGVKIEAFADGKSLGTQTLDIPAGQQAAANRFSKFPATLGAHVLKIAVTFDGKTTEQSRSFEVKKGVLLMRPTIMISTTASLAFTGNDIQVTPTAQPGKPSAISVNVKNPAGVPATNAQFEAFADGKSLGKVTKTIGAMQSLNVGGFQTWTPPAGTHKLRIVASVGRRQIAAEKNLNVINTLPLRSIVRPSVTITRPIITGLKPGGTTRPGPTNPPGGTLPVRPGVLVRPGTTTPGVDVGVSVDDIKLTPPNPSGNQDVTIGVTVHNFGAVDATGAMLMISYVVDQNPPKSLNLPISVPKGGTKLQNWRVRLPAGQKLTVAARVTHKDDSNARNATANTSVNLGGGTTPVIPIRPILPGRGSGPDVAIAATDISHTPASPKENDTLNFTVVVRNLGQANANGAKLTLTLNKDGTLHEKKEFTLNIAAGQTATQRYSVRVPKARQLQLVASVSVEGDTNARNGQATDTVNVVQTLIPIRPGTIGPGTGPGTLPINPILAAPDVQLGTGSIVPGGRSAAKDEVFKFTLKVKNGGRGLAKNAKLTVRFLVDGRPAGVQNFTLDVAGGATIERTASLRVPAGRSLQCSAEVTVEGDTNPRNNKGSVAVAITG